MDRRLEYLNEYDKLMKRPTMSEEECMCFLRKYELEVFEYTAIDIKKQWRDMNIFQMYDTANYIAAIMRHPLIPEREQSITPWSPGTHK